MIDLTGFQLIECGDLRIASPPDSSLADCILQLWRAGRLAEFARLLPLQAQAPEGEGFCALLTLSFLNAAGDLPVSGRWARTPVGWHSYVVMSGEAFDVLPCEGTALVGDSVVRGVDRVDP